ncbi:unnamed protein product [Symbiodinium sp. CCMP2456]|nr:unnamed protein product [Symbiodinium sp. CCMP2456]
MPRSSKLAKKGNPKAKASPVANKPSSPATAKTEDPAEKPTKTPKSTPPAATTKESPVNKKARTTSPDKNQKKTRGRSPPSDSHEKSPKKARAAHSPKKPSASSPKKGPKKAPEGADNSSEKSRAETPKTSGENADSKKSEKDPTAVEKKRQAHKLYMRFWRSVNECKTKMTTLYEDFTQCQGKWQNSYIMKTIRQKHKNGKRAARRWLTKAQLKAHFNDDSVVDAIIIRKETDKEISEKEIRDHPDLPGLKQYLVLVEDEEVDESTDEIEELFCMHQKHGSDSSSDGSQDGSNDDSSSSASAKKKKDKKQKKDKKSKKDKSKTPKKKGKGKPRKGKHPKLNRTETQEDLDKEQSRKVEQEGKKVINILNRKIKEATAKIESPEVSSLTELVRDALKKDLQAVVKRLTSARTQLQSALDSVQDDRISQKTTAAKEILDQAEGSLTVGVKKKTEKKGGD